MAIKPKPKSVKEFINEGAKTIQESIDDNEESVMISLRIKKKLLTKMDIFLKYQNSQDGTNVSRNFWIIESIRDKLNKK